MANVRITENGIEIPLPGQMKASVEMSEDMLCEFMQYRKDREELTRQIRKESDRNRQYAEELCKSIYDALEEQEDGTIKITNEEALKKAFSLAVDWFC